MGPAEVTFGKGNIRGVEAPQAPNAVMALIMVLMPSVKTKRVEAFVED